MHKLIIHNLGPIDNCELTCRQFMTFTGEQASGKSTIAKVLYYFRTVKDDVYEAANEISIFPSGSDNNKTLIKAVREKLRRKFFMTFGYQVRELKQGMRIKYYYTKQRSITLRLLTVRTQDKKVSFILNVQLSDELTQFINGLKILPADEAKIYQIKLRASLDEIFNDDYDTIYIPSGRSMLTLLSDYIRPYYIHSTERVNNIDYCTQKYIDILFRIKNVFAGGTEGIIDYYRTGSNLPHSWEKAQDIIHKVLCGSYRIENGEERIILDDGNYVRINFASSGQQDALWITNLLFYYLVRKRPALFIIEEPESHLFPSSQKYIMELISLLCNQGYSMLVTTHSPYVLGTLNNLLYVSSFRKTSRQEEAAKIIPSSLWLDYDKFRAWFVKDGKIQECMDHELRQIKNEMIDGISDVINDDYDTLSSMNYVLKGY